MTSHKRVLFIVPYPVNEAPSQRFRFEQYFDILQSNFIQYEVQPFLTTASWKVFYAHGKTLKKVLILLIGFCRRAIKIFDALRCDFVFIHREATPIGPPIFEWIIARILRTRIIYDFDDAIWLTDKTSESSFAAVIKWRGKVSTLCKLAYRVSCGNKYLADFAGQFNASVVVNPTTIDTKKLHNPHIRTVASHAPDRTIVGWTGSHSTLKYLQTIETVLQKIEEAFPQTHFLVIADKPPKLNLKRLNYVPWNEASEIFDLMRLDIGIMPLPDDEWSKGKCGFKILQYMSLGIPSVSSPVGVNTQIVEHGVNGYLCATDAEWIHCVGQLIGSPTLREKFGTAGRATVAAHYSVDSNTRTFLSLFE